MRKLLLPFLTVLFFTSCQKQISKEQVAPQAATENSSAAGKGSKIDVCHKAGPNNWHTINISINALPAHLAHGDVLPDADDDDYTKANPCGVGSQNDCNDNNAAINPGAIEICGNNIDDNCNGQVDENCIATVTICDQVWMLKNLDVTKYRNGDDIPQVTDATEWGSLTTGAWCYYANSSANGTTYGKLYNWYAVNDPRGLAPSGWHVPSDAEWTILETCLGGPVVAGGKMKETGITHWLSPNTDATNSSGFTGLPGGYRESGGGLFADIGSRGVWWSSTDIFTTTAYGRYATYDFGILFRFFSLRQLGFSVRCVKD